MLKEYPIFNRTLAQALIEEGHKCLRVAKNKKNPKYDVYYFEQTTLLKDALSARKKVAAHA